MALIPLFRRDGWKNLLTGVGKQNTDKTMSTTIGDRVIIEDQDLATIYDDDGLATRIVDTISNDMTRPGWEIKNDTDFLIYDELERLGAQNEFNKALKYARLFRGAVIVIFTENGELDQPFSKNPGRIRYLRTYSASRVQITSTDIVNDPKSPYFDDVEIFTIQGKTGVPFKVHRSRCLVLKGDMPSDYGDIDLKYRYWGFSVIQRIWDRLKNYGSVEQSLANLMMEAVIGKYTLSNLSQLLSQSADGIEQIYNRIEIINASKSIINAVLLDENERFERDTASFTGIPELIDRMQMNLSAISEIPVSRLFGRSPAGLNSSGENDIRIYYDKVASDRNTKLLPELRKLVNLIGSYMYGKIDTVYEIEFNPLWQATDKEKAEIEKINADTDNIYMMSGVLDPDEVRQKRFPELDENLELEIPEQLEEIELEGTI